MRNPRQVGAEEASTSEAALLSATMRAKAKDALAARRRTFHAFHAFHTRPTLRVNP